MTPHAFKINEKYRDVAGLAIQDLYLVQGLLEMLPNRDPEWTCHGLCRLVEPHLALPWVVRDGYYSARRYDHAWLETTGQGIRLVLDVYPVAAISGPALFDFLGVSDLYVTPRHTNQEINGFFAEAETAREMIRKEGGLANDT